MRLPSSLKAGVTKVPIQRGPPLSSQEPWLNAESPDPTAADLNRALALYRRAMLLLAAGLAVLALI